MASESSEAMNGQAMREELHGLRAELADARRAQETLRWAQQASNASGEAMFRVDDTGHFLDVNRAACEMYGWSRDELLGKHVYDVDPERPAGEWPQFWPMLRLQRRMVLEGTHCRRSGETFPVRLTACMLEDAGEEQCLGVVQDLTAQRRHERLVYDIARGVSTATGHSFFRSLLEHLAKAMSADCAFVGELLPGEPARIRTLALLVDGVEARPIEFDLAGTLAAEVVYNGARAYQAGVQYMFPKDALLAQMGAMGGAGTPLFHSSGRPLGLLVVMTRGPIPDLGPVESLLQIFGVRAAVELDRQEADLQLRQAQRLESVGLLAGGIAHDFNNLLTVIQGYTDLAIHELGSTHATSELLAEAQGASHRAGVLTKKLLAFARRQEMTPRRVALGPAIGDVNALLRPLLGERIRTSSRLAPDVWAVHVDPGQLEQVLVNLAVNARDAMPGGGEIHYEAENVVLGTGDVPAGSALTPGEYVRIAVRDTGTGMPPEVMARIFEPFFTTKGPGKGTGIGLATCHGIVRQSGGHITVTSVPGRGTTFALMMPRAPADAPPPDERIAGRIETGQGTILVVEDDPFVRQLARRALGAAGYSVLDASSGEAALALLSRSPEAIDLLLTDVVMPGMTGIDLADRLKAARPGLGVLFTTGYMEGPLRDRLRLSGARLLEKPYTPSVLTAAIRDALT